MKHRDIEKAARVIKIARINSVSDRYVNMVINDERKNDQILTTYMELQEAELEIENKLLLAVKELVPFPSNNRLNSL